MVTAAAENTSEPDQKSESRGKEVPLARTDFEKRISLNPRRSINVTSIAFGDGWRRAERERERKREVVGREERLETRIFVLRRLYRRRENPTPNYTRTPRHNQTSAIKGTRWLHDSGMESERKRERKRKPFNTEDRNGYFFPGCSCGI